MVLKVKSKVDCEISFKEKNSSDRNGGFSKTKVFKIIDPEENKKNGNSIENIYYLSAGRFLVVNEKKAKGGNPSSVFSVLCIDDNGAYHFEKVRKGCSLLNNF